MSAAFFITNRTDTQSIDKLSSNFADRGFVSYRDFTTSKKLIRVYATLNSATINHTSSKSSALISIGTLIYPKLNKAEALSKVLDLLENQSELELLNRIGSHCLIHIESDKIHLHSDPMNLFPLFIHKPSMCISSSFLVLSKAFDSSIDIGAVRRLLVLGYIPRPFTIANEIKVLEESSLEAQRHDVPVAYYRSAKIEIEPREVKSRSLDYHAELQLDSLEHHFTSIKTFCNDEQCDIGISGGYDSRLLTLMCKKVGVKFSVHTLNKGSKNPDLTSAASLAKALNCELNLYTALRDGVSQEVLVKDALTFYDARPVRMMNLFSPNYTSAFRCRLLAGKSVSLNGVGGEVFRNHYHNPINASFSFRDWINYILLDPNLFYSLDQSKESTELVHQCQNAVIQASNVKAELVDIYDIKRFYAETWLRDWHGTRNSIENQVDAYHSPFIDRSVVRNSYKSIQVLGFDGRLEGRMIFHLDDKVAKLPSSYGYPLSNVPARQKLNSWIKSTLSDKMKMKFALNNLNRKQVEFPSLNNYEKSCLAAVSDVSGPINASKLLSTSGERRALVLSVGAVLKHVWEG